MSDKSTTTLSPISAQSTPITVASTSSASSSPASASSSSHLPHASSASSSSSSAVHHPMGDENLLDMHSEGDVGGGELTCQEELPAEISHSVKNTFSTLLVRIYSTQSYLTFIHMGK